MPSSIVVIATLFGLILGVLLDGALGGMLAALGTFLLLRVQQLSQRVQILEAACVRKGADSSSIS